MKVDYVTSTMWCALYVNDQLYAEGEAIPDTVWLELVQKFVYNGAILKWKSTGNTFPDKFENIISRTLERE